MLRLIRFALPMILLGVAQARADFSNDGFTDEPDVLLRIVTAAESHSHFKSHIDDGEVLYLRSAKYVGPLETPFGLIHVASLFYVRSSPKGGYAPARGHSYIVFLDQSFKIRAFWSVSFQTDLAVRDNKLWEGNSIVLDYGHLPMPRSNLVTCDGQPREIPKW
jgi:hypothetical protein